MKRILTITIVIPVVAVGAWFLIDDKTDNDTDDVSKSTIDEIDTENLQTYRNEEYGYKFQYPEKLFLTRAEKDWVALSTLSPDSPKRESSIGLASSISFRVVTEEKISEIEKEANQKKEIQINGNKGRLFLYENHYAGDYNKYYYFRLNPRVYLEIYYYGDIDIFDEIIQTFEF